MVKRNNQDGFSLIELLIVVVVIGIVATIAVPAFQRGVRAAENGSTFAVLRGISSSQVMFYSQNNRFAKIDELHRMMGGGMGVLTGDTVVRGPYVFELTTAEDKLPTFYTITATRSIVNETVYKYELTQTGRISRVLPAGGPDE